jgi:hypothetical protein
VLAYVWRSYAQFLFGPLPTIGSRQGKYDCIGLFLSTVVAAVVNCCINLLVVDSGAFSLTACAPKAHGSRRGRAIPPLRGECISPSGQLRHGLTNTPTDDCALLLPFAVAVPPTSSRLLQRSMPLPARSFASYRVGVVVHTEERLMIQYLHYIYVRMYYRHGKRALHPARVLGSCARYVHLLLLRTTYNYG